MAEFLGDLAARLVIQHPVFPTQRRPDWAARVGTRPAGQLSIAGLRIGMPQAVRRRQTGAAGQVLPGMQMLPIALVRGNQGAVLRDPFGFLQHAPLVRGAQGDVPGASALGPAAFEDQPVAAIRPPGLDLHGLGPAQPEGRLELEADSDIRIGNLAGDGNRQSLCLAAAGGRSCPEPKRPIAVIAEIRFADLGPQPPDGRQPVHHGGVAQSLAFPLRHGPMDMPVPEPGQPHTAMPQPLEVAGKPKQHSLALILCRPRPVPVRFEYVSNVPLKRRHAMPSKNRSFPVGFRGTRGLRAAVGECESAVYDSLSGYRSPSPKRGGSQADH